MKHVLDIEQLLSGNYYKFSDLVGKADGIMITGSYATKSALNYSDIDIIVLSQRVNYLYSESIYYRKKNIHIIFFPYYKFQEIKVN
ncbi:MAG: nucleotidyltransferase domain-containing protein [Alistipes sp.]|nr:nucleotidyltransferase domain-containing protein [Alistipes sp.]